LSLVLVLTPADPGTHCWPRPGPLPGHDCQQDQGPRPAWP